MKIKFHFLLSCESLVVCKSKNENRKLLIKININLRGREWVNPQGETKYFNSIQGWRIENLQTEAQSGEMPPVPPAEAFELFKSLSAE